MPHNTVLSLNLILWRRVVCVKKKLSEKDRELFAGVDLSLSELININEFFGTKAIVDHGTDEQKGG